MGKNQWVSPRGNGWGVHGENNAKDTKHFSTQAQAHEFARQIAIHQKSEVIIQRPDGRIPVSYTHLDVYKRQGPCRASDYCTVLLYLPCVQ